MAMALLCGDSLGRSPLCLRGAWGAWSRPTQDSVLGEGEEAGDEPRGPSGRGEGSRGGGRGTQPGFMETGVRG